MEQARREGEAVSALSKENGHEEPRSELEQVLAYHGGDALAAVQTLLDDCRHLRGELALAEGLMSAGIARGWRPQYERQDDARTA